MHGYRLIMILPQSPAHEVGLVPFLDVIMAADGRRLQPPTSTFHMVLNEFEDKPLLLSVYNRKTNKIRELDIIPSKKWGGQSLFGALIHDTTFTRSPINTIRIINILPNSPCSTVGLHIGTDYILGTVHGEFKDLMDFQKIVEKSLERDLNIFVYNSSNDSVIIRPNNTWGGQGLLGLELGFGILHNIPDSRLDTTGHYEYPENYVPWQGWEDVRPKNYSTPNQSDKDTHNNCQHNHCQHHNENKQQSQVDLPGK